MNRTFLVTGGAGFIGISFVNQLIKSDTDDQNLVESIFQNH